MGKSTISMAIFNSYVSHYQRLMDNINNHKDQQNCDSLQSEDHRRAKLARNPIPQLANTMDFSDPKKKVGPHAFMPSTSQKTMFFFLKGDNIWMCFSKWHVCIA